MTAIRLFFAAATVSFFAACQSSPDRAAVGGGIGAGPAVTDDNSLLPLPSFVRTRVEPPPVGYREVEAAPDDTAAAALRAASRLGYSVRNYDGARIRISGQSMLDNDPGVGRSRQRAIDVRIREIEPGRSSVALALREQTEERDDRTGDTTIGSALVRDPAPYETFHAALMEELSATVQ
jgi:hypothetical protein